MTKKSESASCTGCTGAPSAALRIALLAAMSAWCWGSKTPPPPPRPTGSAATVMESYSSTEIVVEATGVGKDPDAADLDVPLVAIQFVLFRAEDRIVATAEEERAAAPLLDSIYGNPRRYIAWSSDHATSTRRTASGFEITRKVRVNKGELGSVLERAGVVKSHQQLEAGIGTMSIAVVPDVPAGEDAVALLAKDALAKLAGTAISSYLTQRQYNVRSLDRMQEINATRQMDDMTQKRDVEEGNPASPVRSISDVDVRIGFTYRITPLQGGRQASITVNAIDASSMDGLGSETGYSAVRPNASEQVLIQEAAKDAIDKVLQRLNNYWKTNLAQGPRYYLEFHYPNGTPAARKQKATFAISGFLQRAGFTAVKLDGFTSSLDKFTFRAPVAGYPGSIDVMMRLGSDLAVPGWEFAFRGQGASRNLSMDATPVAP